MVMITVMMMMITANVLSAYYVPGTALFLCALVHSLLIVTL